MRIKHLLNCGITVLGLAASLSLSTNSAQATLLAYEGFNYTDADGTVVSSIATPGGIGWTGIFGASSGTAASTARLTSPGLNYTGFYLTPGSKAMAVPVSGTYYRPYGSGSFASPQRPADGTYWYSALLYMTNLSRGGTLCVFGKPTDPQNGFGVRADRAFDNIGSGEDPTAVMFQAWGDNGGSGNATALKITNGFDKAYFILGKIVMNTNGTSTNTIWVYEDPAALPLVEPVSGGLTHTVTTAAAGFFKAVTGRTFSTGGRPPVLWDEVRVATTFAEVLLPTGPAPTFALSPTSGIENQTLAFNWVNIPGSATSINLNPGAVDLLPLTTAGAGNTTLAAPATNTTYILTYVVAGTPTSLTNQFTVVAPFFTLTPSTAFEPDNLTFNWRIPVGSTSLTITPDLGPQGDPDATGVGSAPWFAPGSNTTFVLDYTYNSNPYSLTQQFTLAAPFFTVPSPAVEFGALPISWRIPLGFSSVFLQNGPVGGPYTNIDVTADTTIGTGAGSFNTLVAGLGKTNFTLFYTNAGIGYSLSTNILTFQQIFTNLVAVNNLNSVQINGAPMQDGVLAYTDRSHVWSAVPSILQGAQFVKFAQQEKFTTNLQVSFTAAKDATFFLILDNRVGDNVGGNTPLLGTDNPPTLPNSSNTMAWVLSSGFVDSGVDIGLDENPVSGTNTIDQSYSVYFRQVSQGATFTFLEMNDFTVGGPGGRNMYGVAGVSPQVTPIAFIATLTSITNGQSTTLQWTVPVGSDVSINNGVGNVSNITDVVFGTGSTNIVPPLGTNIYTLTYNPPGTNTPPVNLAPVTVVVVPVPVTIPTTPTNITFSVSGGVITLGWPAEYLGWSLQRQTNALGIGLSTNWETLVGSELVTSTNLPVNEAAATFFRMFYTIP